MPFTYQQIHAEAYLHRFDRILEDTLPGKKDQLNLLSISRTDHGTWRMNYDETLRVLATVTPDLGEPTSDTRNPLRLSVDVAFQKMTNATWVPWDGVFGTGSITSTTADLDPPLALVHGVIKSLAHEAERPEIRKALRVAKAYDRTHGLRP